MVFRHISSFLRFSKKHKVFTLINLLGLSVGFLATILILSYCRFQLSFDSFHKNSSLLHRIHIGEGVQAPKVFPALANALTNNLASIKSSVRIKPAFGAIGNKQVSPRDKKIYWADDTFFDVFTYDFKEVTSASPLSSPFTAAISKSIAEEFFPSKSPLGEIVSFVDIYNNESLFTITAVFHDPPSNSHLKFDVIFSYNSLEESASEYQYGWSWRGVYTYIKLAPNASLIDVSNSAQRMLKEFKQAPYSSVKDNEIIRIIPVTEVHTLKGFTEDAEKYGSLESIYVLMVFSILLFVVALFNYLNLTSVSASFRLKEVGVKKVLGAKNSHIITQFIVETAFIFIIAYATAFIISLIIYPEISGYLNITQSVNFLFDRFTLSFVLLFLVIGVLSTGLYTYTLFKKVQPAEIIKGQGVIVSRSVVGNFLMVFQFVLSISLIVGVFSIGGQIDFMLKQNVGVKLRNVVVIKQPQGGVRNFKATQVVRDKFAGMANVSAVSSCDQIPGRSLTLSWWDLRCSDKEFNPIPDTEYFIVNTDKEYLRLFEIELLAGRNFNEDDKGKVIINQSALMSLGFDTEANAVGRKMEIGEEVVEIIGVISNYHHRSLKENISPIILQSGIDLIPFFAFSLEEVNKEVLNAIESEWKSIYPESVFDITYLEDSFNMQYVEDSMFYKSVMFLSVLVIAISSFGLIGVSIFTTEKRSKEMAIRKILGSSTISIQWLFFRKHIIQLVIASLVALPISFYLANSWISRYPFKINLTPDYFILPVLLIGFLSFITVGSIIFFTLSRQQLARLTKDN